MEAPNGIVCLLGIEQGVVCCFEAVHIDEQFGVWLIGGRDFDCVSVTVWPPDGVPRAGRGLKQIARLNDLLAVRSSDFAEFETIDTYLDSSDREPQRGQGDCSIALASGRVADRPGRSHRPRPGAEGAI